MINIENKNDNECFRWCHLAFLFPPKNYPERISKYKEHTDKIKYNKINFPVKLKDIPKIENMNDDIRFNVYGVDDKSKSEMRSFKSNENIHKKEGGSYYVVSANKASSVTL